jgi:dimethylargininase
MATVRLDQKRRAIVRNIPLSFTNALANYFGTGPKDVDLARHQHGAYIEALKNAGIDVHVIDADENHPDCVFVEDQAVVIDGHILLPVPGHPSRVKEQPPISKYLQKQLRKLKIRTCKMGGEARMDGGDILRLGNLFFVGRSTRTNDRGIFVLKELLEWLGYELRIIDIPSNALHLTSISSTPTDSIILTAEGYLTAEDFGELPEGVKVVMMPENEVYGCNTIGLPGHKVLIAQGYPSVARCLENEGLEVIQLDFSEIRAADGSLTCCSIFY